MTLMALDSVPRTSFQLVRLLGNNFHAIYRLESSSTNTGSIMADANTCGFLFSVKGLHQEGIIKVSYFQRKRSHSVVNGFEDAVARR
jgi:hypothetical protein